MSENNKEYKVKCNGFDFTFTQHDLDSLDIVQRSSSQFHLIRNHRSYTGTLLETDEYAKHQTISIEGESYQAEIKEELDLMLDKLGFNTVAGKKIKEMKAPMPGLVLEVNVTEGQEVKAGDKLLILVAMKMENSIMIQADATIKRIAVQPGQAVEKGQVLVELD